MSERVSMQLATRSTPTINLSNGHEVLTAYAGAAELVSALQQNNVKPTALTTADFDEDGVPDLISGYAAPDGGIVTIMRGNVDALYPHAPEAAPRRATGTFTAAPFLAPAHAFALPAAPDFLGAGDFDADGHWDIVAAERGGTSLTLLAGDGHGHFTQARQIALPGAITALTTGEINRADGLTDVVVGVQNDKGAEILVFEGPDGALRAEPESLKAPDVVNALALGQLDNSFERDLIVAAGRALLLVRGRERKLSIAPEQRGNVAAAKIEQREFTAPLVALAIGDFTGAQQTEIATLDELGTVHLIKRARQQPKRAAMPDVKLAQWPTLNLAAPQTATQLIASKLADTSSDSLLFFGQQTERLSIMSVAPANEAAEIATLNATGAPAAVLPMRLNDDGFADLVALQQGQAAPTVVPSTPAQVFTVNTTADNDDGTCDATNCTLREAIKAANSSPGADTINFNIPGGGIKTITPQTGLPGITNSVTIDATTQPGYAGTPVIVLNLNLVTFGAFNINNGTLVVRGFAFVQAKPVPVSLGGGSNHIVESNYFGFQPDGTFAPGMDVCIDILNASNSTIGGTTSAARNIIAGPGNNILVHGVAGTGNIIEGNYIGLKPDGLTPASNNDNSTGLFIYENGSNTTVGGTTAGARNVFSGNVVFGINISDTALDGNLIQGNFFGLDATGTIGVGNGFGVSMAYSGNTVGGTTPAARNIVSDNSIFGVGTSNTQFAGNNVIQGNYFNTDVTGTVRISGSKGVDLASPNNTLGGTAAGAGNVISGSVNFGLTFEGPFGNGNVVQGNYIGTNAAGTAQIGNQLSGIWINGAANNNTIGGTVPEARNVISGNFRTGVDVYGNGNTQPTGNKIQGNYIGLNAAGTARIANGENGVAITVNGSGVNNTIGGATTAARNVISGNLLHGIAIGIHNNYINTNTTGGTGVTVQNNYIGTDASGQNCIGNRLDGIFVDADSNTNTIADNVIACNGRNGVNIPNVATGIPGLRILIDGNNIYANGGLGIDLGDTGITPNDALDTDGGANLQQNFPVLTSASAPVVKPVLEDGSLTLQSTVTVNGTLSSAPNTTYIVQWAFYADAQCVNNQASTPSLVQGKLANVTTDGQGNAAFNFSLTFPPGVTSGVVNTKAIDPQTNTSEFGPCLAVNANSTATPGNLQFSAPTYSVGESGGSATVTVTRTNGTSGAVSVNYATSNGTAIAGSDYTATSGTLNWADGDGASKTFTVPITNDALDEPDETVNLTLSTPTGGATLGTQTTAVLTITDDDPTPSLSINDVTQAEGNSGTTNFTFTVTLSAASGRAISVNYATAAGTATSGADFAAVSGTLNFNPGDTSKQVQIGVVGDTSVEPDETFFVNLSSATNATITKTQGTGTISNDDSAPTIQFSAANYTIGEGGARATVTVTRSGDTSGTATVDYHTADADTFTVGCADAVNNHGAAYARCDFTTVVGTLSFAAGETSKTINVPVIDDAHVEGAETFQVVLANPSGASLGTPNAATISINDNDAAGAPNPVATSIPFFVREQYLDFLSREPESGEPWSGVLNRCADINTGPAVNTDCDRIAVSADFFGSPEFQLKGFYVFRFYKLAFNRLPQYLEIIPDMSFVAGATADEVFARKAQLANSFTQRGEFQTTYGGLTNSAYVAALLNRYQLGAITTPDPAQPDGSTKVSLTSTDLTNRLNAATLTRAQVFRAIADSDQVGQAEFNSAFVAMQYYGYLRRTPETAGYQSNLSALQRGVSFREMVNAFLNSTEYKLRFGQP